MELQLLSPIERVKLLVQNQNEMIKQGVLDKPYKGVMDCTMRTFKTEGEHFPLVLRTQEQYGGKNTSKTEGQMTKKFLKK